MERCPALDPKSLDFTVQVCLLAYPSLFRIRAQVINHLYCVLGNGFDWWDGRLRENSGAEKAEIAKKMLLAGASEDEIRAAIKTKDDQRREAESQALRQRLKELGIEFDPPPLSAQPLTVYSVCDRCKIMNLPERIRPDWLAGAEEAVGLMETHRSFDEADTLKNKALVPAIRERIAALKAKLSTSGTGEESALAI